MITVPKTKNALRSIKLPEFARLSLLDHRQRHRVSPCGLVFATGNDTPFSSRNLIRHYHDTLDKAGIPRMRFHDLRHTTASLLLKANIHPKIVQAILGHSTITLTLDTYSHLLPGAQDEAAEKMNKLLG